MGNYICDGEKYKFGKGYIYLPLEINNLPKEIKVNEYSLSSKTSFHCSLVCIKRISPEQEQNIIKYFCDFVSENEISFLNFKDEFRLVKKDDRVSIVAMCEISNIEKFFKGLEEEHNIKAEVQPTHVTIYTLEPDKGIGILDNTELQEMSSMIEVTDEVKIVLRLV